MTELLFESYGIPLLCYGVNTLFAYNEMCKQNKLNELPENSLIISLSYSSTHLIPRLNGKYMFDNSKR